MKKSGKKPAYSKTECPHCRGYHREGARFCSRTGKTIEEKKPVNVTVLYATDEMPAANVDAPAVKPEIHFSRCPHCNKKLNPARKARFCNHCGKSLSLKSDKKKVDHTPKKRKKKPEKLSAEKPVQKPAVSGKKLQTAKIRHQCPYNGCENRLNLYSRYCPECYRRVIQCPSCHHLNEASSVNCRNCSKILPPDPADWSMFKGDPARTGNSQEKIEPDLILKWIYPDKKDAVRIVSSPVVRRGMVFYGSCDSHIHALNQYSGELIWKRPTNGIITSTPAIWEDVIYAASCDGRIYAQKARTGKPLWVYPSRPGPAISYSSPLLVCDEGVVAASDDGRIVCLDQKSGKINWKADVNFEKRAETGGFDGREVAAGPLRCDEGIVIAARSGRVFLLDHKTGNVKWRFPKDSPVDAPFIGTPVAAAGNVYTADRSGRMYAIKEKSGEDLWNFTVNLDGVIEGSPSVGFGKVLVGTQTQYLVALNLLAGGETWRMKNDKIRLIDAIFSTPLITRNELVFVGANSGYVYCRDLNSGDELWKHRLKSPVTSNPAVSDGFLYVTSTAGFLYAFCEREQGIVSNK